MNDLNNYLDMDLLRFTTAGSVDDGKSTLIGRLFHDTKSIFEDQLEAIERSSKQRGDENVNLALLTDGLRAEREQGITIDVIIVILPKEIHNCGHSWPYSIHQKHGHWCLNC